MHGPAARQATTRVGARRATLAVTGMVLGSGGVYVAIWAALGFVLR